MAKRLRWLGAAGLLLFSSLTASALDGEPPKWPDTPLARLQALAILETFNAEMLSTDSATLSLDRWCQTHHLASPAKVVAERDRSADKLPTDQQRLVLGVDADEPIRYRRVKLTCGDHILSRADNWYVPSRIPREFNTQLDATDVAFGRLLQPLHFSRRTLAADLLWRPLPGNWDMGAKAPQNDGPLTMPGDVLQHTALLSLPDGRPIAEVVETYTSDIMAFPQPELH